MSIQNMLKCLSLLMAWRIKMDELKFNIEGFLAIGLVCLFSLICCTLMVMVVLDYNLASEAYDQCISEAQDIVKCYSMIYGGK